MRNEVILKSLNELILEIAPIQLLNIKEETDLRSELGFDSLSMVELLVNIEESFGIELNENFLNPTTFRTVLDLQMIVSKYVEV